MIVLEIAYIVSAILLALIGLNSIVLTFIYLLKRQGEPGLIPALAEDAYPSVVVQLPIYNEQHVVKRLIHSVSQLDYPRDRLLIQVLDDSTDETMLHVQAPVEEAQAAGLRIEHIQRGSREGFKAGALAYGLTRTDAEFVAVFDADFAPYPDFLRRVLPHFLDDDRLGLVQTRWSHLNAEFSLMTRAQALALDAHFIVEQTARNRGGLLMNFAGTAGVWRRSCIEGSGGWQGDTLSEDIDLSYRAQLAGWHALHLPYVDAPAEIPPLMMGLKRQQQRWATGTIQCLVKLKGTIWSSSLTLWQKIQATLHLSGYFAHPLILLILFLTGPLMLSDRLDKLPLAGLGIGMLGMPLQILLAQRRLHTDWPRRFLLIPLLMALGVGTSLSNSLAVLKGLSGRSFSFERTPKFQIQGNQEGSGWGSSYMLPVNKVTWIELMLAVYAAVMVAISVKLAPTVTLFMAIYMLGYGYVAGMSLLQDGFTRQKHTGSQRVWGFSLTGR